MTESNKKSNQSQINMQTLHLYWQQVRRYKPSFFLMLLAIPLGALCIDTLLPYFLAVAIGTLSAGTYDNLTQTLWMAVGVGLAGATLNALGFQAMVRHESSVRSALGIDTFSKIIHKDMNFFVNTKIGALTTRYIDFVRNETTIQDLLIIRTLGFVLSVGAGIVILFFASPIVSLIIFALIIVLLLQVRWSLNKRAPWRHERKELVGKIHGHVADSVTNYLVVKTFAREKFEKATIEKLNVRFREIYKKDIGFVMYEGSLRVAFMVIVQIIAIATAAHLVVQGSVSVATAIFALAYLQRIGSQLFVLGDMLNGYDQALLDAAPMTEMLLSENIVEDASDAQKLIVKQPSITFDEVSYRYSKDSPDVLNTISLEIPAGQKIGLVGHSGAGKTTLTHLLLRFANTTHGAIYFDGQNIANVTQESLRGVIAYVPQEPLLFHRTLRENIAYGRPEASDKEVRSAAKQANALEFIDALPQGLDTLVGERGVKLSGGQRQRVAIARAILKNAPILILDEATSALDSESEQLIKDALEKLMKDRTSIVIAHRLSTISRLDRIIVMNGGKIIEDGPHTELLKQKGVYAKLWARQSGGFIEE